MENWSWEIDGWIILAGALCAASAALLGNYLVLRRQSLLGDAISHAVLPGLAAAFLLTGERQGWGMFIGAAAVGILTVFLTEFTRHIGRVDEGASIGVVFTFLFALGLVMIVQAADQVDLDPECVLYGSIETSIFDRVEVSGFSVPRVVVTLSMTLVLNATFVCLFYRPLLVSTFDAQLARSQGIPTVLLHYSLAGLVAITCVASFESVGNILVVAMFVVPPIAAWLLTDRLTIMILLSVLIGVASAIFGHLMAIQIPAWWGFRSTSTAGMMAVAAGVILASCVFLAPGKGLLPRLYRHWEVSLRILGEDVLAMLYRSELNGQESFDLSVLERSLLVTKIRARLVIAWLSFRHLVDYQAGKLKLTQAGHGQAQNIVRSHRLWEHYLANEAGMASEFLHGGAEKLEHFTDREMRQRLVAESNSPDLDPHGSPIPPEA